MSKATWDTQKAKGMWQAGFTDKDIAQEVGTTAASISYYRRKHWVEDPPLKGALPDAAEECEPDEGAEPDPGIQRDEQPDLVRDEGFEEEADRSQPDLRRSEGDLQMNMYEVLEAATGDLCGIRAICTADAISSLWNWKSQEDLLKAKAAIDFMLQKLEGLDGKV